MSFHYEQEFGPMFTPTEIKQYEFLSSYEDPYNLDLEEDDWTPGSKSKSSVFVKKSGISS